MSCVLFSVFLFLFIILCVLFCSSPVSVPYFTLLLVCLLLSPVLLFPAKSCSLYLCFSECISFSFVPVFMIIFYVPCLVPCLPCYCVLIDVYDYPAHLFSSLQTPGSSVERHTTLSTWTIHVNLWIPRNWNSYELQNQSEINIRNIVKIPLFYALDMFKQYWRNLYKTYFKM